MFVSLFLMTNLIFPVKDTPYCNEIITPVGVWTPPTVAISGTSPVPRLAGSCTTLSWYSPAEVIPAKAGSTVTLLIDSWTEFVAAAAPE
jgi:hypothetical protein